MKNKAILAAVITLSLTTGASAFAQNMGRGDDRRDDRGRSEQMQRGGPGYQGDRQGRNDRNDYRGHGNDRRDANRGAGPRHDFRKGGRIDREYRNRQYVVNDWRGHRLSAPPRGYSWVQTGGDYVLIAVATGIIAQIVLGN